jgi:hypothetical protein
MGLFSSTFDQTQKNIMSTESGAADVAKFSLNKTYDFASAIQDKQNRATPFTLDQISSFMMQPGQLPTLTQPPPLAQVQTQQQAQQQNSGDGGGGFLSGLLSIAGPLLNFFA